MEILDLVFDETGQFENDGIGSYEYCGARGYDEGHTWFCWEGSVTFKTPLEPIYDDFGDIVMDIEEYDLVIPCFAVHDIKYRIVKFEDGFAFIEGVPL